MEKILSSDVALELKRYDIPGIVDQYSLNDYLKEKNLNCEFLDGTVSKGKILIHKKNNR